MKAQRKSLKALIAPVVLASTFFMGGCNATQDKKVSVKSEEDKVLYTMGIMFGGRLKDLNLSEKEMSLLVQGLSDSATGKELVVKAEDYQMKVQAFFTERMKKNAEKVKVAGQKFIDDFVKKEGAKKTKSGLAYKILKEGTGKMPKATDTVEVHYHGTLPDGTVFDSSKDRGKTATFPLNRVVKGWTEGLQLVKVGGKIKLVIPADLGYGDQGAPPRIPGGSTLVFEVELIKIIDKDAKTAKAKAPKK